MDRKATLGDFIRDAIRDLLRDEFTVDQVLREHVADEPSHARRASRRGSDDSSETETETTARTKRGRTGARVAYVVNTGKRGALPKVELPKGTNPAIVWTFVQKKAPVTAKDIEKGTKLGKKAVESAVYMLRQIGAIRSEEL
jgi:Arc/MetJ-type ribon-helix-helix transcriptional regulator